jgi:hypothetical protein
MTFLKSRTSMISKSQAETEFSVHFAGQMSKAWLER